MRRGVGNLLLGNVHSQGNDDGVRGRAGAEDFLDLRRTHQPAPLKAATSPRRPSAALPRDRRASELPRRCAREARSLEMQSQRSTILRASAPPRTGAMRNHVRDHGVGFGGLDSRRAAHRLGLIVGDLELGRPRAAPSAVLRAERSRGSRIVRTRTPSDSSPDDGALPRERAMNESRVTSWCAASIREVIDADRSPRSIGNGKREVRNKIFTGRVVLP